MSSWNSALNAVLVFSARSTHSSPSTLRRVFIPFLYASRLIVAASRSGKISCQGREEFVYGGLHALCRVVLLPVGLEVGFHSRGIDHERGGDGLEKVEAGSEGARDLGNQWLFRLTAAERALVLRDPGCVQCREQAGHANRGGERVDAGDRIALVRHRARSADAGRGSGLAHLAHLGLRGERDVACDLARRK